MDFICSLTGFRLFFSIYKLIKKFKSKPQMSVDSIIEIGNNSNVQGNNNDESDLPTNPSSSQPELTPFSNPYEPSASTSQNNFLSSFQVNQINGANDNASYEPVVPQLPADYPMSEQEKRDRRLSRLPMADFPPPPSLTAQQRLKVKTSVPPSPCARPKVFANYIPTPLQPLKKLPLKKVNPKNHHPSS